MLAATCDFGDRLEESLRDRLVMGLKEESTQRALLTEKNLTFGRAVELATAREAAARDVREFGHSSRPRKDEANIVKAKTFSNTNDKYLSNKSKKGGKTKGTDKPKKPCSGCGASHWKSDCPFTKAECYACKKIGHIAKVCFSKDKQKAAKPSSESRNVSSIESSNSIGKPSECVAQEYIFSNSTFSAPANCPYYVKLDVADSKVDFQVDTGAAKTLMSYKDYMLKFSEPRPKVIPTHTELRRYGGSQIPVCGEIHVKIKFRDCLLENRTILIVKDEGPSLLGRDILPDLHIRLNIAENSVYGIEENLLISRFPRLFEDKLGMYEGLEVSLEVDPDKAPHFFKARNVPYAMRSKVDAELDRLLQLNIIVPITHSSWAAPIVPVLKGDGTIRICGDYRLTVNQACKVNPYPVPRIEDLFATLGGGTLFSKLDMKNAYNQLLLDEESKPLTTINTHRGLFQYNRLSFGIASAPAIFQKKMDELLKGIPGVAVFLDDILVSGSSHAEHESRLCEVLSRLECVGLKLHPTKCSFGVSRVTYLGFSIDASGLKPTKEKLEAILNAPEPKDVTQLRSYLGMLNFYRKFLVRAAAMLEPLNSLLRKDVKWNWTTEHSKSFQNSKSALLDVCLLNFDPSLPIVVSADSSSYGLGAVLCQLKDGVELPVVFASRTLNKAERNYSQTEKEVLALVYALKKFHHYLWGMRFSLITDHKPLLGLFSPKKPIPEMSSGRIQRWSLMLQAYNFELFHRSGVNLGTADALSRLPLDSMSECVPVCAEWVHLVEMLDSTPVTAREISKWTATDPLLSKVVTYLDCGWPMSVDGDLKPFFHRKDELSIEKGCVLWGSRVIIPKEGRESLLNELHREHMGSTKMKQLSRSYFWWPGLDNDIEKLSAQCSVCLAHRSSPKKAPLHPWEWPEKPWLRLHADYAGPVMGRHFLVIVDAHTKWIEVLPTKDTSSSATISLMRHVFSHFGLPMTLVTDNGPNFCSKEFECFLSNNGIRHITSAPYQPSTNGQAENAVKTFKMFLKHCNGEDWKTKLDKFLFQYRVTPHQTTGISPSELMFGRKLRTVLDLVHPGKYLPNTVWSRQDKQKTNYDAKVPRTVELQPESPIMVRNYSTQSKDRWVPARVVKQTGPVSYKCELPEGNIVRRHQDQIHSRALPMSSVSPQKPTVALKCKEAPVPCSVPLQSTGVPSSGIEMASPKPSVPLRRSARDVKPPTRLDL